MTMEKFLQKERDMTRLVMIEPSSLKQIFKRGKGKLGWNPGDIVYFQKQKLSALEAGQVEKETDQGNETVKIWCECDQFYL